MRIKWNRHLDGSSSRRQDEGATDGTEETDDKKTAAASSSTPGIFKIFRRKKKRGSSGDDCKTDDGNGCFVVPQPPPSEAAEDDCASISSVATCASQPATEGFHRDRSSSLFSSFRLSLPGSKRKKRKIAPTPSETVLNGQQQNEPQVDRYSTPDLRKPPDKLDVTSSVAQVNLSTSSPSIRSNPKGIPSSSAQSLDVHPNSESLDKLKWPNRTPKLSKSVSFSDCCKDGGLVDSAHSSGDNKAPRAVNRVSMVEEDCGALESESPPCLSDNLLMTGRESKLTASFGDDSSSAAAAAAANVPSTLQKRTAATAVAMTKTEEAPGGRNSKQGTIAADIGHILNDIATEIQSYEKDKISSAREGSVLSPTVNCDSSSYSNGHNHQAITAGDELLACEENRYHSDPNLSRSVQRIETLAHTSSTVSQRNTDFEPCHGSATELSCHEENDCSPERCIIDKSHNASLNSKLEVLTSELSVLTAAKNLSELAGDAFANDVGSAVEGDPSATKKCESEMPEDFTIEKHSVITSDKHVVCRMKIYDGECPSVEKSEDSKIISDESPTCENSPTENSSLNIILHDSILQKDIYERETVNGDIFISKPNIESCFDSKTPDSFSKVEAPLPVESSAFGVCSLNVTKCDQEVPECNGGSQHAARENHSFLQTDQQVPEFELSLKEFEEVCSKYMSRSAPGFSDSDTSFPLYSSNSPKPKSVLDLSYSLVYPHFRDDEVDGNTVQNHPQLKSEASVIPTDLIPRKVNLNSDRQLQNSCQSPTKELRQPWPLPLPPKQWNNSSGNPTDDPQSSSASSDGTTGVEVQCTNARGKYLCQEPCPGDLPTTTAASVVMPDDFDTPQLSSGFETESGREKTGSWIVTGEKQQFSDAGPVPPPSEDTMISSNARNTLTTLNGVLDCTYIVSESPPCKNKSSSSIVFLDPEIRDNYRGSGPRAICDPLIYSTDATTTNKGLESLGHENYLSSHNFSNIRSAGLCEVINDDYVSTGKGLIEISNPYEDAFILPQDLSSKQNFVSGVSISLRNGEKVIVNNLNGNHNFEEINSRTKHVEKSTSLSDVSEVCNISAGELLSNGSDHARENRLSHVEQKNLKNNKNSMIPCRKKSTPVSENNNSNNKKIELKTKSKKSNSLPRFNKPESHLPVKNVSSPRMFSGTCKDSELELQARPRGKRKDPSVKVNNHKQPNGICLDISSTVNNNNNESGKLAEVSELGSNSHHGSVTVLDNSKYHSIEDKNSSSPVLEPSCFSNGVIINLKENSHSRSFVVDFNSPATRNEPSDSKSVLSTESTDNNPSIPEFHVQECKNSSKSVTPLKCSIGIADNTSECAVSLGENNDGPAEEICSECCSNLDVQDHVEHRYCSKHSDYNCSRRSSLSAFGMRKTSYTSSKESLSSQLTSSSYRGKSRIPKKQPGTRGAQPSSKGPVRPPMWLSKAELTQEIQRLGTLCEARTKELNRLKMETKHVSVGFDAFAALFKYMVEDLNGLSVPALTQDLEKTLKQLELTKQDLAYYEREVEEMKSHHCQELNDLSNKLFEVYQSEVAELNAKHQEEVNHIKTDNQKQIEHLKATFDVSSTEAKAHHEKAIASLEQEIVNQREELQQFQEREIKDIEEKHAEGSKLLQDHIEQLQKKCAELKQHSMSMEDAMRKDTDSKLQWVTAAKLDLEKEVESLKTVLEMKNKELHTLRVQNLEMEKQLEELPLAREKIKMLQARAEDLEALMAEKTKLERKLSTENQQMRETYEKETKVNRRLSMENEELQWRLRQAENSLISGSFSEVPEFPEAEENAVASPTKSPPQMLSRSVFFTFVDKDESSPRSPRSQYKKITPNFSANYRTSPAKSSKSPPAPSPRRGKSHSEPPQPITFTSTPRKVAKQPLGKTKQKRHRSGSDSAKPSEHVEVVNFSSVTESMASSVSSESSVFEHRERLLDEQREQIIKSLEILREQRSTEGIVDEPSAMEKKWCSDDIKITGELSNLETEDMSRSAEFSDPKTYYHMTFPVLKESGVTDCDIEDGCKNSSSRNSPMKEVNSTHSMSENNIHRAVETSDTLQVMSMSSQEVNSTVVRIENKRISCAESSLSAENVQRGVASDDKAENRWRTI